MVPDKVIRYEVDVSTIVLPDQFNYPFYYEPHPLSFQAAAELQHYLETQKEWTHNFGIDKSKEGLIIGKMFGILVIKDQNDELGYLAAFSGKLANSNHHRLFVPPVYDMLEDDGYFKTVEAELSTMTYQIERLQKAPSFISLQQKLATLIALKEEYLNNEKIEMKILKRRRKEKRERSKTEMAEQAYQILLSKLKNESLKRQWFYNDLTKKWDRRIDTVSTSLAILNDEINQLKIERRQKSNGLQAWLFDQYKFLNVHKESQSLIDIFKNHPLKKPPAGAGECTAPKLLQYAFLNGLKPICISEFWWGSPPKSAVRKHKQFYPSCRGKCHPILNHMLKGIKMDPNPMLANPGLGKDISFIYEDDHIAIINKPAEFLSVPGKEIEDSVLRRLEIKYPSATGPLLVHRLDMSTSGILIMTKSKEMHTYLQKQFIRRIVKKRYVALLDGTLNENNGLINLPLRVDLDDRPRQLVCFEHGKNARTEWKVIERKNGQTRIHFYPITGRTHQLRVHAAHIDGLNMPIVGDDLYGSKADRLHLHAEWIQFIHPFTKETIEFNIPAEF